VLRSGARREGESVSLDSAEGREEEEELSLESCDCLLFVCGSHRCGRGGLADPVRILVKVKGPLD
jgi:hypothetical protein